MQRLPIKGKNRYILRRSGRADKVSVERRRRQSSSIVKEMGRIFVYTESAFDYEETIEALKRVLVFSAFVLLLYWKTKALRDCPKSRCLCEKTVRRSRTDL